MPPAGWGCPAGQEAGAGRRNRIPSRDGFDRARPARRAPCTGTRSGAAEPPRALDSSPEEAVERRLHGPALRVREQRLRERERGEIHRDFLAQPPELRLIGEPLRVPCPAGRRRRSRPSSAGRRVVDRGRSAPGDRRAAVGRLPSRRGGELRFRPAGRGQIDRADAPQCQYDRRQHDQPDQAQRSISPDALTRLDGAGPVRHSSDGLGRSTLTLGRTTQRAVDSSAAWADLRKTRGQAPRRQTSRAMTSSPLYGSRAVNVSHCPGSPDSKPAGTGAPAEPTSRA